MPRFTHGTKLYDEQDARKMFEILHANRIGPSEEDWDEVDQITRNDLYKAWVQVRNAE